MDMSTIATIIVFISYAQEDEAYRQDLEKHLQIPTKRRFKPSPEIIKQAIVDEVERDLGRRNGPDYIQEKLRLEHGLHVGR